MITEQQRIKEKKQSPKNVRAKKRNWHKKQQMNLEEIKVHNS